METCAILTGKTQSECDSEFDTCETSFARKQFNSIPSNSFELALDMSVLYECTIPKDYVCDDPPDAVESRSQSRRMSHMDAVFWHDELVQTPAQCLYAVTKPNPTLAPMLTLTPVSTFYRLAAFRLFRPPHPILRGCTDASHDLGLRWTLMIPLFASGSMMITGLP